MDNNELISIEKELNVLVQIDRTGLVFIFC